MNNIWLHEQSVAHGTLSRTFLAKFVPYCGSKSVFNDTIHHNNSGAASFMVEVNRYLGGP